MSDNRKGIKSEINLNINLFSNKKVFKIFKKAIHLFIISILLSLFSLEWREMDFNRVVVKVIIWMNEEVVENYFLCTESIDVKYECL